MNIVPKLSVSKLKFNEDSETHVVVGLTAPLVDWQARRLPICLMLVIDVSGSMDHGKLNEAKKSAYKIIENLNATDYCGVATFNYDAKLVSAPMSMTTDNKEKLSAKIKAMTAGGGTNFSGGMVLGLREVNKSDIPKDMIVRVVMLTDGYANVGVQDEAGLGSLLNAELGAASVSAFGYGAGANQDLMSSIAKNGRGNYAFIGNDDDALTAYGKELGGLLSMYARNIIIKLSSNNKMTVVTDAPSKLEDNVLAITLSDILSEESRNVVISMKTQALSQTDTLFEPVTQKIAVSVSYDLLKANGSKETKTETHDLVLEFVNPGDEDKPEKALDEIVAKAQMARAQLEAEQKANQGDYDGAVGVMNMAALNFKDRGHDGINSAAIKIGSKMSDRSSYAVSAGYRNTAKRGLARSYGVSSMDSEAADDLKEIGESLTNAAQDSAVVAFTTPSTPPESK